MSYELRFSLNTPIGDKIVCASLEGASGDHLEVITWTMEDTDHRDIDVLRVLARTGSDGTETWLTTETARDLITALTYWVTEVEAHNKRLDNED